MTMLNEFYDKGVNKAEYKTFLALLNPFAPHITEELWQQLGETGLLSVAPWPTYDEAKTVESTVRAGGTGNKRVDTCGFHPLVNHPFPLEGLAQIGDM